MNPVILMHVKGVVLVPSQPTPVMLLREVAGERRWLAITIGTPEASALRSAREGLEHGRPDTIELVGTVLAALGRGVARVQVTGLRDGVFFAELVLDTGLRLSARPGDAVVIGLRAGAPVEAAESVLETAAVDLDLTGRPDPAREHEHTVAAFRELLERAGPNDFGA